MLELLHSSAFRDAHRVADSDFTRRRCLSLPVLVGFVLQHLGNSSLQSSLDVFFSALSGRPEPIRAVSKSAFCQARRKLKASAFEALNRWWTQRWHEQLEHPRWQGLRVVAGDGTCLRLPNWPENVSAFGDGPCGDGSVAMARCVGLLSVGTGQLVDVRAGSYAQGERALLLESLDALHADDVLVLDRGYPAWWLFAALQARQVQFCVRIDACGWPDVARLLRSSARQIVVHRKLRSGIARTLRELGLPCAQTLSLRLVKVRLPSGRIEVLASSLIDDKRYPAEAFGALYGQRWAIEEAFKTIKHRLHIEGWSGELPHAIMQDIAAKTLMHNLTQALCEQALHTLPEAVAIQYCVNHAYALRQLPLAIQAWIRADADALAGTLNAIVALIARTREKVRPGRSFARKHSIGGAQRPRRAYR